MADRTVPTTDTFDQWRTTYNLTGTDVGDIADLNTTFTATPTDLVEAIIKSIYLKNNFEIINIGSGKSYSIRSIVHVIQKIYHTKIPVKNRNIVRRKEILQTKLDIKKAKKILKWEAKVDIDTGIRKTIQYFVN